MADQDIYDQKILLGKPTDYIFEYDASLIFPIARKQNREKLNFPTIRVNGELPFFGFDVWTGYEVSWLNQKGKPVVVIAEFIIPLTASHIVESKSFKLYLNSFNQTKFASVQVVQETLIKDLSAGFGADVNINLYPVNEFPISITDMGMNIDELDVEVIDYEPNAKLIRVELSQHGDELLNSHLLKSNCPVTGQPDWATVVVKYKGCQIEHESLLKYLISFRGHDDFHEHCVEQIFCDLLAAGEFEELMVSARYTRRGGLDINPTRSLTPIVQSQLVGRTARQ